MINKPLQVEVTNEPNNIAQTIITDLDDLIEKTMPSHVADGIYNQTAGLVSVCDDIEDVLDDYVWFWCLRELENIPEVL